MAEISVKFMHPTDARTVTVTVDDTMTAEEAIAELIVNEFINPNPQGYNLALKGGAQLQYNQSFAEAGVNDGNTIRVIPATDAGNK